MSEKKKIVLAYSGGLDTSVILKWLVNEYDSDVTLRELIYDAADGIRDGNRLKGVIPGGISAPILTPEEIDTPHLAEALQYRPRG